MLRAIQIACMAAAAVVVSSAAALAGPQDFTVYNYSDQELRTVFVVPDYAGKWGLDALGDLTIPPGTWMDFTVDGYGEHCLFDVQVITTIGEVVEFWGVDLCEIHMITIESEETSFDAGPDEGFIFG